MLEFRWWTAALSCEAVQRWALHLLWMPQPRLAVVCIKEGLFWLSRIGSARIVTDVNKLAEILCACRGETLQALEQVASPFTDPPSRMSWTPGSPTPAAAFSLWLILVPTPMDPRQAFASAPVYWVHWHVQPLRQSSPSDVLPVCMQFFILYKSAHHLDFKHTVFGRVVGGKSLPWLPAFSSISSVQQCMYSCSILLACCCSRVEMSCCMSRVRGADSNGEGSHGR